jgi:hypothetical protein
MYAILDVFIGSLFSTTAGHCRSEGLNWSKKLTDEAVLVVGDGDLEILPHPKATVVFCFLELNVLCSYRRPFMFFYVLSSSKNNCCVCSSRRTPAERRTKNWSRSYHYLAQLAIDKKISSNTCTNCWHLEGCSQLAVEVISLKKSSWFKGIDKWIAELVIWSIPAC